MRRSIGFIEFKSIAKGIEAVDFMLKSGDVGLVFAAPICPGKYICIVSGNVGAVENSLVVGRKAGGIFAIESYLIPNVNEKIFPALSGTCYPEKTQSIGIIETMSAITSIVMGDAAVKAANIELIEIRIARGLGGKGFVIMTGDVSAVKSAVKTCEDMFIDKGEIVAASVIASPSKELIKTLY